jgi:hypothetical protein
MMGTKTRIFTPLAMVSLEYLVLFFEDIRRDALAHAVGER